VIATPAVDEKGVYFGDDVGNFYKLDKKTGKTIWNIKADSGSIRSPSAIHVELNAVYFATGDARDRPAGEVFKVNTETGAIIWKSGCAGEKSKCDTCGGTPTLFPGKETGTIVIGCGLDMGEHHEESCGA